MTQNLLDASFVKLIGDVWGICADGLGAGKSDIMSEKERQPPSAGLTENSDI